MRAGVKLCRRFEKGGRNELLESVPMIGFIFLLVG
jgi:hypothetical protein